MHLRNNINMNSILVSIWLSALIWPSFSDLPTRLSYTSETNACGIPSKEEWGSYDALSTEGLLPRAYMNTKGSSIPQIKIIDTNIVCITPNLRRDSVQVLSAVVKYECMGVSCPNSSDNPVGIELYTHQIFLTCHAPTNSYINSDGGLVNIYLDQVILSPAAANLSTPLRTNCRECLPSHTKMMEFEQPQDPNPQGCVGMS